MKLPAEIRPTVFCKDTVVYVYAHLPGQMRPMLRKEKEQGVRNNRIRKSATSSK